MNFEIRLQKPRVVMVRRAVLVIVVLVAWTVAVVGIMRDRDADTASSADPRIEKKAPTKPYYSFMLATPV
jgi:hypothetical protein